LNIPDDKEKNLEDNISFYIQYLLLGRNAVHEILNKVYSLSKKKKKKIKKKLEESVKEENLIILSIYR